MPASGTQQTHSNVYYGPRSPDATGRRQTGPCAKSRVSSGGQTATWCESAVRPGLYNREAQGTSSYLSQRGLAGLLKGVTPKTSACSESLDVTAASTGKC